MGNEEKILKEFLKAIIKSYGLSNEQLKDWVDSAYYEMLIKAEQFDLPDEFVPCPKDAGGRKLLCVDEELRVVDDFRKAVAIVGFFKETDIDQYASQEIDISKKLINIAFLKSIAKDASFAELNEIKEQWRQKNYPDYHATLISYNFQHIARYFRLELFDACWTRSFSDDGYPTYRGYRVSIPDNKGYTMKKVVPNLYVSVVMEKEDFLKINPDIVWDEYELVGI